jgi:hypothetical protein
MPVSEGRTWRTTGLKLAIAFSVPVLVLGMGKRVGLGFTLDPPKAGQAPAQQDLKSSADATARQITEFAIQATPGPSTVDPRLGSIRAQLRKVLPGHGFKLLDVESKRIEVRQSVTCELGNGYKAETVLVRPIDDAGKVHLRCTLSRNGTAEFSTLVKTPVNQLFFYERSLADGTKVMIGVGARDIMSVAEPPKPPPAARSGHRE